MYILYYIYIVYIYIILYYIILYYIVLYCIVLCSIIHIHKSCIYGSGQQPLPPPHVMVMVLYVRCM